MKDHLLLKKAHVYSLPRRNPNMGNNSFDNQRGFWVMSDSAPFILDESATPPRSKKCDIETGEDRKGE